MTEYDIPAALLALEIEKDLLLKLSRYLDLSDNLPVSSYQAWMLSSIIALCDLKISTQDKQRVISYFIENLFPIQ
jgi:hypothetical protein